MSGKTETENEKDDDKGGTENETKAETKDDAEKKEDGDLINDDVDDEEIINRALEEGADGDEDEDDKDDGTLDEDDPEADKEKKEKEEEEEALADLLGLPGDEPEEDGDSDKGKDKDDDSPWTDEELFVKASGHTDWDSYMKSGDDDTKIDQSFVAQMIRERVNPQWLEETSIYGYRDLMDYVHGIETKVDPEAIILPQDEDGKRKALQRYVGVPESPEDYPAKVFSGTTIEDDDKQIAEEREWGLKHGLNEAQLAAVMQRIDGVYEEVFEDEEQELAEYKAAEAKKFEARFGKDAPFVRKEIGRFFRDFGQGFAKEHKGKKVMNAYSLADMIYTAIEKGTPLKNVTFDDFKRSIRSVSDEKLIEKKDQMARDKRRDPGVKGYKKHQRLYKVLLSELNRRGIEY